MPNLKDLRDRKRSVESTRKITSAMKMVSAAKLRRAQEQAVAARPYATAMADMLSQLAGEINGLDSVPKLMAGTGRDDTWLFVVMTSDRGLCGGFNGSLAREARQQIHQAKALGKTIIILTVGRKGRELLRQEFQADLVEGYVDLAKPRPSFSSADLVKGKILELFDAGKFDRCFLVFSKFKSAMTQIPTTLQLIPFLTSENTNQSDRPKGYVPALSIYEPDETALLEALLPRNLSIQIYQAFVETFASEQGARMTAMDSATRNAGDMIRRLDLTYNRARQAYITKELIEIISGAEAL